MPILRRIARIKILGPVVPWSTPQTFLGGRPGSANRRHVHLKDPRLVAWQDAIRAAVDRALPRRTPYAGPVMLSLTFTKAAADPASWGRRWWTPRPSRGNGDLTNYAKAAEDALKSWDHRKGKVLVCRWPGVIEEDSQVCDTFNRKRYAEQDGVAIVVYAIDEVFDAMPHPVPIPVPEEMRP